MIMQTLGNFDLTDSKGFRLVVPFKDIRTITVNDNCVLVSTIYENFDLSLDSSTKDRLDNQLIVFAKYNATFVEVD